MSASTGTTSAASLFTGAAFWERLWRTTGIQSALCFIVGYIIYGHQPQVGASTDAVAAFHDGDRRWILIAAVFYGVAVLNLMYARRSRPPWRIRNKTVGVRRRPPPVPLSEARRLFAKQNWVKLPLSRQLKHQDCTRLPRG